MLLEDVCKTYGVRLGSYQDNNALIQDLGMEAAVAKEPVVAGYRGGMPFILYDSTKSELELLFAMAHELGHIRLGHLTYNCRHCCEMDDVSEREADAFAVMLLAREMTRHYDVPNIPKLYTDWKETQ